MSRVARTAALTTLALALLCAVAPGLVAQRASAPAAVAAAAPRMTGGELLDQAIAAMGGEARLRGIKSLTLSAISQGLALDQSERPEGPWLTTYVQQNEIRDYEHNRVRLETQRRNWSYPNWSPLQTTIILPDAAALTMSTRWLPTTPTPIEEAMALDPERILLTARTAKDLRSMPDETQQKIAQHVVAFTHKDQAMRLLINPWTHLPTMLEWVANDRVWGDVTTRRWYSFWTLEKGGLMYPRQVSTEWNGYPRSDETVQGLVVDGPLDESAFAIPDDTRAASVKLIASRASQPAPGPTVLALDASKAIAVNDFIAELPGGYNVSLVRQPDGIVVIEGTTSSDYSEQVLAYVAKTYPGVPVKAIVTTSDAWPHVGGIRPYVARGVPLYPLDLNVSILSRVITAPHTLAPDALSRAPKLAVFRPVTNKTTIGSGDTRMELIPVRGETGERMMIAWFPGAHLLYSSDLIQRGGGGKGFFMPEMLLEVSAALDREQVTGVERVFGMHLSPTPWTDVQAAIAAAKGGL